MKTSEKLKPSDFARKCEKLLRELLERVPSLKLVSLKPVAGISPGSSAQADRLAQVEAGNRKWTLLVEEKRLAQPHEVRSAVLRLESHLKQLPGNAPRYGVLLDRKRTR